MSDSQCKTKRMPSERKVKIGPVKRLGEGVTEIAINIKNVV